MLNLAEFSAPHNVAVYSVHVIAGIAILASATVALFSRKGARKHILSGRTFVILSILAGVTALVFMNDFGFVPNIYGTAVLAISVIASSFFALRPQSATIKALELVSLLLTLSVTVVLLNRFLTFSSEDGLMSEAAFFTFGCAFFPLFFLVYDTHFITRPREQRHAARLKRHMSGMAFGVAVMVHAPVVSVFTEVDINFYLKFFGPYLLWPAIYYYYVERNGRNPVHLMLIDRA